MFNFQVKKLDNFKFSHQELLDYFNSVEENFSHLRWNAKDNDLQGMLEGKTHRVEGMCSYAIQSNYKDPNRPCMSYHVQDKTDTDYDGSFQVETDLVFGFAKKLIDTIPNIRQTVISIHPPGTFIDFHVDSVEFVKVHIPIITTEHSYFKFEGTDYNLEVGNAYLINTTIPHGTDNRDNDTRIHLIFKIPSDSVESFLNTQWNLI